MKLTKASIKKLSLPDTGQKLVWDSDLKGFGLRLTPSGIVFIIQARVKGITRRVSIGKAEVLTLDEARKKARKEFAKMLDGKDPALEKRKQKIATLTLQQVTQSYLQARRELKANSRADIEKHLTHAFKDWADKPILKISRDMVLMKFKELTDRGPTQANQAFRNLRALFNFAMATYRSGDKPLLIENPVKILSDGRLWNTVRPRSGRIPSDMVGAAWNILQALRDDPGQTALSRTVADYTCFLLLTGARRNEAAELTWDRVNLENSWWYLPDPKNKNPVKLPLSQLAREILKARPQDSKWVFPAITGDTGHIATCGAALKKINAILESKISAHDLRRTFRAIAAECQIELWRTKLLMNHKLSGDVTISAYTEKQDLTYLGDEINRIAEWILHGSIKARDSKKIVSLTSKGGNRK